MIQSAVTYVVSPAVAADDPHALFDERVGDRQQVARLGQVFSAQPGFERRNTLSLDVDAFIRRLVRAEQAVGERLAYERAQFSDKLSRVSMLVIERHPHPEPELGVIFKKRIAPCGATPFAVDGVRRGRQIAAVDARTARRVGDDRAVAEELRDQLDVRRFAAARARARKLEQRLEQLHVLDGVELHVRRFLPGRAA